MLPPDFQKQAIQKLKDNRVQERLSREKLAPVDRLKLDRENRIKQQAAPLIEQNVDTSRASYGGGQEADALYNQQQAVDKDYSSMSDSVGQEIGGTYDASGNEDNKQSAMAQGFLDSSRESIMKGTGDFISSTGELTQMLLAGAGSGFGLGTNENATFAKNMAQSDPLSDFMQSFGQELASNYEGYVPDSVENPTLSWETFTNPEFWSVQGGRFMPQLAEIALTAGIAKGVKGAAEIGARAITKDLIKEGVERGAVNVAKDVTEKAAARSWLRRNVIGEARTVTDDAASLAARRAGIENTVNKGAGLLGHTMTSKGNFTKGFGDLLQTSVAGVATNFSVGLRNGGEIYNTYKNAIKTDDDGNAILGPDGKPQKLFSEEEVGQMAADVFTTNLNYLATDILSWGITYGKLGSKLGGIPFGKAGGMAEGAARKLSGGLVSKLTTPFAKNIAKFGGKMAMEGLEESVQETYEEWSKMRAYYDTVGSLKGYQGKVSENYDMDKGFTLNGGFWDYYNSKDSEATRVIAGALGGLAGGAFNVRTLFDKHVDNAYKLEDRMERIRRLGGNNDKESRKAIVSEAYDQMTELVLENQGGRFAHYVNDLRQNGHLTDDDVSKMEATYMEIAANYEKVEGLKMKGKKAYMKNVAHEVQFMDKIREAGDVYQTNLDTLDEAHALANESRTPAEIVAAEKTLVTQKKKLGKELMAQIQHIAPLIVSAKTNQENLLRNKSGKQVQYSVNFEEDPKTGEKTVPVYTSEEYDFNMSEEEIAQAEQAVVDEFDAVEDKVKEGIDKVKKAGSKAFEFAKKIWTDLNSQGKTVEENPTIAEKVDGSIDALSDAVNGVNPNIEEATVIDEEIENPLNQENNFEKRINEVKSKLGHKGNVDLFENFTELLNKAKNEMDPADVELLLKNINDDSVAVVGGTTDVKRNMDERGDLDTAWMENSNNLEGDELVAFETALAKLFMHIQNENQSRQQPETATGITKDRLNSGMGTASDPIMIGDLVKEILTNGKSKKPTSSEVKPVPTKKGKVLPSKQDEPGLNKSEERLFKKTGNVNQNNIEHVSIKQVTNQELTETEKQIYDNFKDEVDTNTKELQDNIKEIDNDPELTQDERDLIKDVLLGTKAEAKQKDLKRPLNEKPKVNEKAVPDDIFGSDVSDQPLTPREKRDVAQDIADGKKRVARTVTAVVGKMKKSGRQAKLSAQSLLENDFGEQHMFRGMAESIVVTEALREMYPGKFVNAFIVDDIRSTFGIKGLGLAIAGQIFVDKTKWNQGTTLMHETGHIYFELMKNDPVTQNLLKFFMKDKVLVNRILRDYDDQIEYRVPLRSSDPEGSWKQRKVFKENIIGKDRYAQMNQATRDSVMDELVKQGKFEVVPLMEQTVIADEIFVAGIEGPMNEKYNKFFENNPAKEIPRQNEVRKWWGKVQETGEKFSEKGRRKAFLETLSKDEQAQYKDDLISILGAFETQIEQSGLEGLSASRRESRIESDNDRITQDLEEIGSRIDAETEAFLDNALMVQMLNDPNLKIEDLTDVASFETFFGDSDRLSYSNKLTQVVLDFVKKYNKATVNANKYLGKKSNFKKVKLYDAGDIRIKLSDVAKDSHSGADYIRRLENSGDKQITQFLSHVDGNNRGDRNMMLQTLNWHEQSMSQVSSFHINVDQNSGSKLELNLNSSEHTQYENSLMNSYQTFDSQKRNWKGTKNRDVLRYNHSNIVAAATRIFQNEYTNADIKEIVSFFGPNGINIDQMIENNRINYNGVVVPLDALIVKFVKSETGFLGHQIYDPTTKKTNYKTLVNGAPQFGSQDINKKLKQSFRDMTRAIINENRRYTANYTTTHADGTQHQSRIIDNMLSREFKAMKSDAKMLNKKEFFKKYSHLNKNENVGKQSNKILDFIYNKLNSGGDIDLVEYGGIKNQYNDNKTAMLGNSDAITERLGQFMTFINSKTKSTYLMDLGRFSDSSKSWYMQVPKNETAGSFVLENGKLKMNSNAVFSNIYNTHKELGYNGSPAEIKAGIEESINEQIAFVEENLSTSKDPKIMELFNGKTLNETAKKMIGDFEVNQIINGTGFAEIMLPSFKMINSKGDNDLTKRAKAAASPMFAFPNAHVEPIYLQDIQQNIPGNENFDVTDSGFYILPEHARMFKAAGGTLMPLGSSFKLLHTGVEKDNKNMVGKNIYNKGYATVLNDEVIAKNPQLKGAYELLKLRAKTYEDANGGIKSSGNILDGTIQHVPMIVPQSANKSAGSLPRFYDEGNFMSYEALNQMAESGNFEEASKILDRLHYEDGDFIGVSGANFGIQQVMDINRDSANMSVQLLKSLTSGMSINENKAEVENMLSAIKALSEEQIQETFDLINNGSDQDIRAKLKTLVDRDLINQTEAYAIFNDNVSMQTPLVKTIVKNTFANYIKQNGLKLKTPGGILREMPNLYRKQNGWRTSSDLNATKGNDGLSFYQQNANGKISMGEAVIPRSMTEEGSKRNKLIARQYLAENGKSIENNLAEAKRLSSNRSVGYGKVFDNSDNHIGYYVEGDTILATRIPSHGVQSSGVFEVVDFTGDEGQNIQLPNEFKNIIGSDNDGDQIFAQHRGSNTAKWNAILKKIQAHYLNPQMWDEIHQPIDFKDDVKNALKYKTEVYGKQNKNFVLPYSSKGRSQAFKDTIIAKANVGLAADLHTTLGMFRNYGVEINTPVSIDGQRSSRFMDVPGTSVTIKSAKLFNIILDNAKNGNADMLGINTNTVPIAMVLSNLNFGLDKVTAILNHPLVLRYSELSDNNTSVFNKDEKYNVMEKLRTEFKINNANSPIDIETENIQSSAPAIYALLNSVKQMNSEILNVGSLLSSHNTMSVNAMEIDNVVESFDKTVNNQLTENGNRQLIFPAEFQQNPIVQNYRNVILKNKSIQKKIDPVYSEQTEKLYKEIIGLSSKDISQENHAALNQAIEMNHTANILGLNEIDRSHYESLIAKNGENNIFDRLNTHIESLKQKFVYFDEQDKFNSITALDNNLLLTKGINFNSSGNANVIARNADFHDNTADDQSRAQMIEEFNELPADLKNDLILYDLMNNGWSGFKTLFPVFGQGLKMQISNGAKFSANQTAKQTGDLRFNIIKNNPNLFSNFENVLNANTTNGRINPNISTQNKGFLALISKGDPFMFRTTNPKGESVLVKFNGFDQSDVANLKDARETKNPNAYYAENLLPLAGSKLSKQVLVTKNKNSNLDYIAIPSGGNSNPDPSGIREEIESREDDAIVGREQRNDYWNYAETLSRNKFDNVMEYAKEFEESRKAEIFRKYEDEKMEADKLSVKINEDSVKAMPYEKLMNLYYGNEVGKEFGEGVGFGKRNKFANAKILKTIVQEIAVRNATEQSLLTGREYDGKDIGIIKKYFMTNNIPSNHPAAQHAVRSMETEYKSFLKERQVYMKKINEATNDLLKEQFGDNATNTFQNLKRELLGDKDAIYKQLYGPLIEMEKITKENGDVIQNMKYKSKEQVELDHTSGVISPAQYKFYKATTEVTNDLAPYVLGEDQSKYRKDYIPHSAPSTMEMLSKRGLLGLMVNSKTVDQKIYDVKIDAINPITGKLVKGVNFKNVEDWYNNLSKTDGGGQKAVKFVALKHKAIRLSRKGINEDGSPLRQSEIEIGSALGTVFRDRFSKQRSDSSTDFPTMDLNKAFSDYTHGTLFQHGNGNFSGFMKMVPVIDGVIAQASARGDKNMAEYVDKIWNQYFLSGTKQSKLPNIAALEAVGITSDKVIDFMTKGSLVYWLGYKGLAMGGGLYAIGNVLAGKYHNLLDVGGKKWVEGEKRFWLGSTGKFDVTDPFRGVRESTAILKKAGFMNVSLYDDVGVSEKSGVEKSLLSLALMPMSYSEDWIQGVHFLSKLNPDEWNDIAGGKNLNASQMAEMEDSIKQFHGKGYTPTDQRMIQMYSWGRAMMQFNRYIPTMYDTFFRNEDVNIYGKETIGTYAALMKTVQKGVTGQINPLKFSQYYKALKPHEKQSLNKALMGFGLLSGFAAMNTFTNNSYLDKLISDSHVVLDTDRMAGRFTPRSILAIENIMR